MLQIVVIRMKKKKRNPCIRIKKQFTLLRHSLTIYIIIGMIGKSFWNVALINKKAISASRVYTSLHSGLLGSSRKKPDDKRNTPVQLFCKRLIYYYWIEEYPSFMDKSIRYPGTLLYQPFYRSAREKKFSYNVTLYIYISKEKKSMIQVDSLAIKFFVLLKFGSDLLIHRNFLFYFTHSK